MLGQAAGFAFQLARWFGVAALGLSSINARNSVMRDIRASVEVRAFIGAEKLRELHGDDSIRYECWHCGRNGRTTEPTSVIVLGYRIFRVVKLAHAACADSQIVETGPAWTGRWPQDFARVPRPAHR